MKIVAVICNIVLFGFTCLVLLVDGPPKGASYIVFTLWLLLTLILSSVVISRGGASDGWLGLPMKRKALEEQKKTDDLSSTSTVIRIVAIICNIVLLGFTCWAFVDQYPHPEEDGLVAFTVLMVLTPILSLVVLFRGGAGHGWLGPHRKRKASEEQRKIADLAEQQDA
jgi:formate hydrogenlyase subunit 3/multisubunit Na+/H+ antiporter MnhD subunit